MKPNKECGIAIIVALLIWLGMAGCGLLGDARERWEGLNTLERAISLDEAMLTALKNLKASIDKQYAAYVKADDQAGVDYLRNEIAPRVGEAEYLLTLYHRAVIEWMDAGTPPSDIEMRARAALLALEIVEEKLTEKLIK